jgi:quinol monooxygenase YgiN
MKSEEGCIDYEMYRNALVKTFEMALEQSAANF